LWFSPAQFPTGDPGIYTIMSHGVNNGQGKWAGQRNLE
jgi:hypothetical protein